MLSATEKSIDTAKSYLDFSGLNELKRHADQQDPKQLKAVAQQFESIFMNMMLKSMRQANAVFDKDNLLDSQQSQFYQELFDHQISVDMSKTHGIGLADMIVKQLSRSSSVK